MPAALALTLFLAVWNNAVNRVPAFARVYVAVNLALAVTVSSLVFGLWHIVPTMQLADLRGTPRTTTTLAGVAVTTVAGVIFCALRLASGSLLAPVLLHLATNCLGAVAARAARPG
jgi:membrane protease YdiL (CAAX protease family)